MSHSLWFVAKVLFSPFSRFRRARAVVEVLALSTLLLSSPALRAQEPTPPPGPEWMTPEQRKRWAGSGEFAVGTSLWGPVSAIQGAMWDAGLTDEGYGGFFGAQTVSYPRIHDFPDRVSYWIGFREGQRGSAWSFGLGAGLTGLGSAEGHETWPGGQGETFVTVKSSAFTFAPMVWLEPTPGLRLGLGPAVHAVDLDPGEADEPNVDPPNGENPIWRAGLLVEAAFIYHSHGPAYAFLLGQYRWLADATVTVPGAGPSGWPVQVPLSHAYVAIGIGMRF